MRTSSRLLTGAAVAALAAASVAACGSTSGNQGSNRASEGSTPGSNTVNVGVVLDQTGVLASISKPEMNGIQVAVEDINNSGGVRGKQIKLLVKDGASDPTVAAAAARSLSGQVQVVLGTATGTGCRAMQPILAADKILQYCQSPQPFDLTPEFFWAGAPTSEYPTAQIAWLRHEKLHAIGFIGTNDSSGDGYLRDFKYVASSHPREFRLVGQQRFASGATNLETQMTHLRHANPDVIAAGTSGGNVVPIVHAMNALGMKQPLYVGAGSCTLDILSSVKNNLPAGGVFCNAFWVDVADQVPNTVQYAKTVRKFATEYTKKFGGVASYAAGGAYDSGMQIAAALKSGATTGTQIASYLETHPYTGVLGAYHLSAKKHQGATIPPIMMSYTGSDTFKLAFSAQS